MGLSDEQLIDEAIECKPRRDGGRTPGSYRGHLVHFAQYLASAHGSDFYRANKKQSPLHGTSGEEGRRRPRSRAGALRLVPGARSARRTARARMVGLLRKGHPSALRFLYHHLQADDELPDLDPTVLESSPRSSSGAATRRARRRSSACWRRPARAAPSAGAPALLYALPARDLRRRAVVRIDLEAAEWEVVGKNDKVDVFPLAPPLIRAFRVYRRRQLAEAEHRPAIRDALADPEKAYVLMTINGRKTSPSTATKIATWHGIRAGVGLKEGDARNRRGRRDDLAGHASLLPPRLGDDRPERREGPDADRRGLGGPAPQGHRDDAASLRADQVRQGAGGADRDAGEVAAADRGGDSP